MLGVYEIVLALVRLGGIVGTGRPSSRLGVLELESIDEYARYL
jgi:hypothetical protein